jgi:uncharacterized protein YjbI with pentapeptide repeats
VPSQAQLERQKLQEEVRQLKIQNAQAVETTRDQILAWAPFVTTLVAVAGIALSILKATAEQRRQRELDRTQRERELEQRLDALLSEAVANLGSDSESIRVSAAVALHNLLRVGGASMVEQIYTIVCANLGAEHTPPVNRFLSRAFGDAARLYLEQRSETEPLDLARCKIFRADLHGLDLEEADIAFASLRRANLADANLKGVRGFEVDLSDAMLSGANMEGAQLHGVSAPSARFHKTRLVAAELRPSRRAPDARRLRWRRASPRPADLRGAEFFEAKLQSARFDGADLRGAHFDGADLRDTFFLGALFDQEALGSVRHAARVDDRPSSTTAHFDKDIRRMLDEG